MKRLFTQDSDGVYPIAVTRAGYERANWVIDDPEGEEWLRSNCQDIQGRLWDVLMVLRAAIRRSADGSEIAFEVWAFDPTQRNERPVNVSLKAVCGPGDSAEPVLTIMLPEED